MFDNGIGAITTSSDDNDVWGMGSIFGRVFDKGGRYRRSDTCPYQLLVCERGRMGELTSCAACGDDDGTECGFPLFVVGGKQLEAAWLKRDGMGEVEVEAPCTLLDWRFWSGLWEP